MGIHSLLGVLGCGCGMIGLVTMPAVGQQVAPTFDVPAAHVALDPNRTGPVFTIGLGAAFAPDYEGSDDYQPVPLWNFRAGNLYDPETYVQLLGPTLRSNFLPSDHWRLGVSGRYIPERDDVDDDILDEFDSVDASILLGVMGGYDFIAGRQQDLGVMLDVKQDVSGDNGFLGTIQGFYGTAVGNRSRLGLGIETTWASEDYMGSYFGVSAGDAAQSGLDQFDADEGWKDVALSASYTYAFGERWSVTGVGRYARLLGDAEDSPVVDDRGDANQFVVGLLANFSF
jgi:MipA family protein